MMDLTPHWQQTQQSNGDAHASLQWVAAKIYEQTEQNVSEPQSDEINLSKALELGLLASNDGKIGFSDPEVLSDYLVRHAVDLALVAWDEREKFASVFDDIYRCSIRINASRKITGIVLLVLNYEYKKDIVGYVADIARLDNAREQRDRSFFNVYNPFYDVLPQLNFEFESLVDALEPMYKTSNGYRISSIVENLAALSGNNADFLYKNFIERPESPIGELAFDALLGLAKLDLQEAHHRAMALTYSEQPTLCRSGIAALGVFEYDTGEQNDLMQITLNRFNDLKGKLNADIEIILVRAYGNLASKSEEAASCLVEFASSHDTAVHNEMSSILFQKGNKAYNSPWYKESLLHLVRAVSFPAQILETLNYCIEHYAKNDLNTAFQVIELIALGWDYSRSGRETTLPQMLNSTFIELYNNHINALNAAITRWFSSSDIRLHLAGSNVINFFNSIPVNDDAAALNTNDNDEFHSIHSRGDRHQETTEVVRKKAFANRVFTLSKEELDTLDEQTVACVLYRLAGYITDARSLAALLLSAIKREPYSHNIAKLIVGLLSEYVLYNYPHETGDYLKFRIEDSDVTSEELVNIIEEALNRSDAYFEARQKLPRLKELQPPSQRTYSLQLAKWKQQNAMMEETQQRSVLSSLFPTVNLKHGRAVSYERDGDFTEPRTYALTKKLAYALKQYKH
ncbi:MAG: hypothetical protein HC907_34490 [Richelia sp. SM1_7_0]|nr:hypothetical protein [Richelia sp. SM1_7_0]